MKSCHALKYLATFVLVFVSFIWVNNNLVADQATELRMAVSNQLLEEARPALENFLQNYQPALPRQPEFEFQIEIDLAQDPSRQDFEVTDETALPTYALKTVYVFLKLEQVTEDLALHNALAVGIESFLRDFFENEGFRPDVDLASQGLAPHILIRVQTMAKPMPTAPAHRKYLNSITSALIAALLLLMIFMLRKRRPRREAVSFSEIGYEPQVALPTLREQTGGIKLSLAAETLIIDAEPIGPTPADSEPAPRVHSDLTEPIGEMNFHPHSGSWYIASLQDASSLQLQEAFERIPFDQALQVLRSFRPKVRNDILTRLNLRPAIRRKVEEQFSVQEM